MQARRFCLTYIGGPLYTHEMRPCRMPNDVFRAIADPTRRAILDLLTHGERTVTDIVNPFSITQPSISEHLRVLREAGLVVARSVGRTRVYHLNAAPLADLANWFQMYRRFLGPGVGTPEHPVESQAVASANNGRSPHIYSQIPMELD
jgi:DNA-binding transcriptional ArsR family regulator